MSAEKQYILAVPNFSDGRREEVIEGVVNEVKKRRRSKASKL